MEQKNLPNATAVLILGILSIVGCCFYALPGLIFGIIALVLAKKDIALYNENPSVYLNYSNLKIGRIMAIIGLVLSIIYFILMIVVFALFGFGIMSDPEAFQEAIRQMSGQ